MFEGEDKRRTKSAKRADKLCKAKASYRWFDSSLRLSELYCSFALSERFKSGSYTATTVLSGDM